MIKYFIRRFVKKLIPVFIDGVIQALQTFSTHTNNTIDDKFVATFVYNRDFIIIWLRQNLKKFIK